MYQLHQKMLKKTEYVEKYINYVIFNIHSTISF